MGKLKVVQETTHVLADRYELGPVIGEGGMARVYRGVDRQLRRPVAVKVLAAPFDRDRSFLERFRREARAAAGLSHPNIVAVFDVSGFVMAAGEIGRASGRERVL